MVHGLPPEKAPRALRRLALVLLAGAIAACGKPEPPATLPTVPSSLATLTIAPERAHEEQSWDGVVEAINQATLSAQTAGRVVELPYDVNDYVEAGSVVVRFTDVEQGAGRNRAKAALASARATYSEAEANYKRVAEIYARKLVSKAALDQAVAARDSAKASLDAADAALREASQQLDYTVIRAPYSGYVTRRYVQVGESVQAGQPLIAGVSLGELRVNVNVPQSAIDAIRRFNAADILLDGDARRVPATKITVFPYADPSTHTFSVRLDLPGEKTGLYPGMTVKVAFATGEAERLLLPMSALIGRGEMNAAYVVAPDGTLRLRQVRLGHRFGDRIEILSGLEPGSKIVADPTAALDWLAHARAGAGETHHD
jgi:RND family efflux transporter MFP subunit